MFVHAEVLRRSGFSELLTGEAVGLRAVEGKRGRMAVQIAAWDAALGRGVIPRQAALVLIAALAAGEPSAARDAGAPSAAGAAACDEGAIDLRGRLGPRAVPRRGRRHGRRPGRGA